MLIVDAYWDHEGRALCPAAAGISHHISPAGYIEPCPPIQFARDSVCDNGDLARTFDESQFLRDFRSVASANSRGCILLENPVGLRDFVRQEKATDTSGRDDGVTALSAMTRQPSHHMPGREIPEKSWLYRLAKKQWFFGFGAYG
jgi:hypothetical protein